MLSNNIGEFLPKEDSFENFSHEYYISSIREFAKSVGMRLQEPDTACRRCNGRGYILRRRSPLKTLTTPDGIIKTDEFGKSLYEMEPLICSCIVVKDSSDKIDIGEFETKPLNRKERRVRK